MLQLITLTDVYNTLRLPPATEDSFLQGLINDVSAIIETKTGTTYTNTTPEPLPVKRAALSAVVWLYDHRDAVGYKDEIEPTIDRLLASHGGLTYN